MAISDWIITKSDGDMSVHLEIDTPIDGTGSLRMSQEDIADTVGVATAYVRPIAGPPQSQFLKGRIRTLVKIVDVTDSATSVSFFGILGMITENESDHLEQAYCAGRWGGTTPSWCISRVDTGITDVSSFAHISQGNTLYLPEVDDVVAIEFEWIYDPLEFHGVRLTFKAAPDDNFSNLITIYQIVDASEDVLTSTVGEGLFMSALHSTPGPIVTLLYDKTANFELVPA